MKNLLSANFSRLLKSKLFWFISLALLAYSAWFSYDGAVKAADPERVMINAISENFCFDHGPVVLMITPVFVSLFLGTEFSDGTVRNKMIVGCGRAKIYFSDFITVGFAALTFCLAWHIGSLSTLPVLGIWSFGAAAWILLVLKSVLFCIAFSAVLCLISHIVTNKAAVAVFEIVFTLVVIMAGSMLYNKLLEPEMISSGVTITADENGNTVMSPIEPYANPEYVAEPKRSALKKALNALPSGQAILLANVADSDKEQLDLPLFSCAASGAIIVLFTAFGALSFKRKDLK